MIKKTGSKVKKWDILGLSKKQPQKQEAIKQETENSSLTSYQNSKT